MGGGTRCRSPSSVLRVIGAGRLDWRVLRAGLLSVRGHCRRLLQCLILGANGLTVFCSRRHHGLTYSRNESRVRPNICDNHHITNIWQVFNKIWPGLSHLSGHRTTGFVTTSGETGKESVEQEALTLILLNKSLAARKMMHRFLQLTRLFGFVDCKQVLSGFLSALSDTHFDQDVP